MGIDTKRKVLGVAMVLLASIAVGSVYLVVVWHMADSILRKPKPQLNWDNMHSTVILHQQQGDPIEALGLAKEYAAEVSDSPDATGVERASSQILLGWMYLESDHLEEAETSLTNGVASLETALSANHPDLIHPLGLLARAYQQQQRFSDAEALYLRSLSIAEDTFPSKHKSLAEPLGELAAFYMLQQRPAEALPLLQRKLAILERHHYGYHMEIAHCLAKLAQCHQALNQDDKAEELIWQAEGIRVHHQ